MTHLNEVQRQMLVKFRSDLTDFNDNIVLTTSVDFSEDGIDIEDAKLPIMFVVGPKLSRNPLFTTNVQPVAPFGPTLGDGITPSRLRKYTAEDSVDLEYDVVIVDNHEGRFMDLNTRVYGYFMNGKKISAFKNPDAATGPKNEYEIDLVVKFSTGLLVNRSNLKQSAGRILIRGVNVSDNSIFAEEYVLEDEAGLNLVKK